MALKNYLRCGQDSTGSAGSPRAGSSENCIMQALLNELYIRPN
jgi:hypothetical protein